MKYPLGNLNDLVAFFSIIIMRSCLSQLSNKYCDCDLQFSMKFSVGEEGGNFFDVETEYQLKL